MNQITTSHTLSRRNFLIKTGLSTLTISLLAAWPTLAKITSLILADLEKTIQPEEVSLEVKIGQMLLVGFRGLTVNATHPIVQDVQKRHIGGIVLFDYDQATKKAERNIQSRPQVKQLVADLQSYATTPLLIAIDYEGGQVNRLSELNGFPPTLSHQSLGDANNLRLTHQHATAMAKTLANLGINLNLAPVVDVNTNPDNPIIAKRQRSFSKDANIVSKHAMEFIKAHHEQGILCSLKHFPGHGSSSNDSHLGLTDVTKTWSPLELQPYANLIKAGLADTIVTAHVFNSKLDPDYPATLSKPTITGLLRGEAKYLSKIANPTLAKLLQQVKLDYDGVVFSDDMQMKAITDHYGFKTAIRQAIDAGVDIIMLGNNVETFDKDIATRATTIIKQLIQEGILSEARINQSYQRIRRLKNRLATPT